MVLLTKKPNPPLSAGDAAAVAHLIVANLILIIGQLNEKALPEIASKYDEPGIAFVFHYIDKPVFLFLNHWCPWIGELKDSFYNFLSVQLVIVSSSVFYGFIVFAVLKLIYIILGWTVSSKLAWAGNLSPIRQKTPAVHFCAGCTFLLKFLLSLVVTSM